MCRISIFCADVEGHHYFYPNYDLNFVHNQIIKTNDHTRGQDKLQTMPYIR